MFTQTKFKKPSCLINCHIINGLMIYVRSKANSDCEWSILHRGIAYTQTTSQTQLSQKATTSLWNVLHHTTLKKKDRDRNKDKEKVRREIRDDIRVYAFSNKASWPSTKPTHKLNQNKSLPTHTDNKYFFPLCIHTNSYTMPHKYTPAIFPIVIYISSFTSISVWKLKRSIFCQLLPSSARTFHACTFSEKKIQSRFLNISRTCPS